MGGFAVMSSANPISFRPEQERRQFKRFPMVLPVQAKRDDLAALAAVPAETGTEQSIALELRDFSLGGMRGASSTPLRENERLTVVLPPFGTRPLTTLTGRVVRCDRLGESFDVGIEFCQTREGPDSSPWLRIPELFYMAGGANRQLEQ